MTHHFDIEETVYKAARKVASRTKSRQVAEAFVEVSGTLKSMGLNNNKRLAMVLGQCAVESARFTRLRESMFYTSADRLRAIFPSRFGGKPDSFCRQYLRNTVKLANFVYANRLGNGDEASGDGARYRGGGFIQLTGKNNYIDFANASGIDVVAEPEKLGDPKIAWIAAVYFCANNRTPASSVFHAADRNHVDLATRMINGPAMLKAQLRKRNYFRVLGELEDAISTRDWQQALHDDGFDTGPIDGLMGSKTRGAINAAKTSYQQGGIFLYQALIGTTAPPPRQITTRFWQSALNGAGIPAGPVDDILGHQTKRAMDKAKALYGKEGDALYDHLLMVAERDDPSTEALQELLNSNGFDAGAVDGLMGPRTRAALDAARESHELEPPALYDALDWTG